MNQLVYQNRQWWNEEEHKPEPLDKGFRMYSDYPFIVRDVTIPDTNDALMNLIANRGKYLERVWLKNKYEEKNNATYTLVFQSKYRSLTNEEVNAQVEKMI